MKTVREALLALTPRPHDAEAVRILTDPQTQARVLRQIEAYPSFALPSPDHAVLVCGVAVADDIGEAWLVVGEGFEKQLRTVLRQMRVGLQDLWQVLRLRQLLILVDPQRTGAVKFIKRLGFVAGEEPRSFEADGKAVEMYFFNANKEGINHGWHS